MWLVWKLLEMAYFKLSIDQLESDTKMRQLKQRARCGNPIIIKIITNKFVCQLKGINVSMDIILQKVANADTAFSSAFPLPSQPLVSYCSRISQLVSFLSFLSP